MLLSQTLSEIDYSRLIFLNTGMSNTQKRLLFFEHDNFKNFSVANIF